MPLTTDYGPSLSYTYTEQLYGICLADYGILSRGSTTKCASFGWLGIKVTLPFTLELRYNTLEVPEQALDGILLDSGLV